MRKVYLDHAATTPVHPEVVEVMAQAMTEHFGNPSSIHAFGRAARKVMEEARAKVAGLIGAQPAEIVFTSGGTEADNMALRGAMYANRAKGNHLITTKFEHHAVLHTAEALEKEGFQVTYLEVGGDGLVDPEAVRAAIRPDTVLCSVMMANNEVGTVQPIREIAAVCRERGVLCHTDAVQGVGNIPVDVQELGVDLLSASGHKIYGPKGIGFLYVKRRTRIQRITYGGGHERGMRPGTENVPGIAGLGKAAELAKADLEERMARLTRLRDRLIDGILTTIPHSRLNGHRTRRLPGNVNVSLEYIEGESILLNLDMKGIAASSGSACTSGAMEPSHVLLSMGVPREMAHGSLRFTLGRSTTEEDIDYLLSVLPEIVERLRAMSPRYQQLSGAKA